MTQRADGQLKNQEIIAHIKKAEKLYSPNEKLNSFELHFLYSDQDTNKVSPFYMRVSTADRVMSAAVCAAIAKQTEKSSEELFRMFQLTPSVRLLTGKCQPADREMSARKPRVR